ncbi:hypothetical protein Tco_0405009, partial [Tanacetum coccineum]
MTGGSRSNVDSISSLDAGNPLHLQTNDNNSGPLISLKLTGCKHNKLMKLMQFLMGLDDVYLPIRSSLLTQTELPDVKDAFVIVCREESHRGLGSGSGVQKPQ